MANAVELAVAYIQIVPSMDGAQKQIAKDLGAPAEKAGQQAGGLFSKGFGGMVKGVAKVAAVAAATVGTAFGASKIFGGGMARLMGIEEAQAKMRGLGHDSATVSAIMDNALASVKGTSFGMAEAATTAAGAVAAGIQPGGELERVLKSVANSAAASGSSMGEMGGIFNKVASIGKAQNDVLMQVADRGIPIYQALADQLGVTADEVFKMASAGKIGFADFEAAMTSASGTVAGELGGALRGSLENMNASLSRIGANLLEGVFPLFAPAIQGITTALGGAEDAAARWGQSFATWAQSAADKWSAFTRGLSGSTLVKDLGSGFHGAGEAIRTHFIEPLQRAGEHWDSFVRGLTGTTLVKDLGNDFNTFGQNVRAAFDGIVQMVTDFTSGFTTGFSEAGVSLDAFINALPLLMGPMSLLGAAIRDVFANGSVDVAAFGQMVGSHIGPIVQVLSEVAGILVGALAQGLSMIIPLAMQLGGALLQAGAQLAGALLPVISELAQAILPILQDALARLMPAFQALVAAIMPLIDALLSALMPVISALAPLLTAVLIPALQFVAGVIVDAITGAIQGVTMVIQGLTNVIQGIVSFVTAIFNGDWRAAWNSLLQIVTGVIQAVAGAIWTWLNVTVLGAIRGGLAKISAQFLGGWNGIKNIFTSAWTGIRSIVSTGWNAVVNFFKSGMTSARSTVSSGFNAVKSFFTSGMNAARSVVSSVWNAIKSLFSGGMSAARSVVSSGFNAVRSVISSVMNAVRSVISSAWSTIRSAFSSGASAIVSAMRNGMNSMRSAVSNGISGVLGLVRSLPGKIKGALGNLGSMLTGSGRALISGFVSGITGGFQRAVNAVKDGMSRIRSFFPFSPAKEGPFSGRGWVTFSAQSITDDFAKTLLAGGRQLEGAAASVMGGVQAQLHARGTAGIGAGVAPAAAVTQQNTIHLPEWVRDLDDLLAFLRSDLAPHQL